MCNRLIGGALHVPQHRARVLGGALAGIGERTRVDQMVGVVAHQHIGHEHRVRHALRMLAHRRVLRLIVGVRRPQPSLHERAVAVLRVEALGESREPAQVVRAEAEARGGEQAHEGL